MGDWPRVRALTDPVVVRLRRAAALTLNNAATTPISWDTEDADAAGFIAVTSSTLTVPSGLDGYYSGIVTGVTSNGAFAVRALFQVVTSNETFRFAWLGEEYFSIPFKDYLTAGQTIRAEIYHNSGSNRNITARLLMLREAV